MPNNSYMNSQISGASNGDEAKKQLILYADDDTDDLELVTDAFKNYSDDVELRTFRDGGQILNYLENGGTSEKPCLIILDINMPVIDGKKVLMRVRSINELANVPVVLFTTSAMPMDETFAEKYNAAFITKPLNAEQMGKIGDRFLEYCSDDIRNKLRKYSA
jgi:CheY-like chemotaxis protein